MAEKKPAARKPAAKKSTTTRKRAPRKTAEVKRLEAQVAELEAKAAETSEPTTGEADEVVNLQRYIRNLRDVPVRFKLERHGRDHRGINLNPRGVRGDIRPIQPEDLLDPIFQANNGLLFEVITADEAAKAVVNQNTNAPAAHPALAAIRNEKGEGQGEMKLVFENPDENSVVVAHLDEQGQIGFDRQGIQRVRERGEAPGTPGYVTGAEQQHAPANEDPSFLSDQKARQKNTTDLGLNVSVAPVQSSPGIISDGFQG